MAEREPEEAQSVGLTEAEMSLPVLGEKNPDLRRGDVPPGERIPGHVGFEQEDAGERGNQQRDDALARVDESPEQRIHQQAEGQERQRTVDDQLQFVGRRRGCPAVGAVTEKDAPPKPAHDCIAGEKQRVQRYEPGEGRAASSACGDFDSCCHSVARKASVPDLCP